MKIIILGAGHTGSALAEYLVTDSSNNITVIDEDQQRLQALQERFDLQVIHGKASYPQILSDAGAKDADMLVAVTNCDETNMIACQLGNGLFHIPQKVARIRAAEYNDDDYPLFNSDIIAIDHIISPEKMITKSIYKLIQYPGTLQVVMFHHKQVALAVVKAYYGGALVGDELSALKAHLPLLDARIVAIYRQDRFIRPIGSTIIEAGDEIYFITIPNNIKAITNELQRLEKPYKRIIISGGGSIGLALAKHLENDYQVKLIEQNRQKAEFIAEQLANTTVLHGESSDQELLLQEQIEDTDLFVAVTSDDESNIMSAMLAKRMGAKKVIVLIQRQAYLALISDSVIDITLSAQHATISALLRHIRQSDIISITALRHGIAEAIEIVAHGDDQTSKVVGRPLSEIRLPGAATIGAIIRNNDVLIANDDIRIEDNDHILVFLPDRKYVNDIERLFKTR
ncbi:Trk system potassium transporter TrkA [Candidatus Schmidhempelia bombi]|uniref:Trk system potassium uptake protein TrkA n=1 Tax=Candidatus Schmidhempelia bombi str. Bimp TaxID=1387197 RepID=A0AB94IF45_9GAMM|nr:Trk system potassium transporter TrkA [Candidatus Schmidhempelia bombi]TEA28133.1 Trk system potassium transporter TrkA [Candidatus Schmidhempelia bombi str. Bimp]